MYKGNKLFNQKWKQSAGCYHSIKHKKGMHRTLNIHGFVWLFFNHSSSQPAGRCGASHD